MWPWLWNTVSLFCCSYLVRMKQVQLLWYSYASREVEEAFSDRIDSQIHLLASLSSEGNVKNFKSPPCPNCFKSLSHLGQETAMPVWRVPRRFQWAHRLVSQYLILLVNLHPVVPRLVTWILSCRSACMFVSDFVSIWEDVASYLLFCFIFQPKERGSTRVHALNNVNRVLQVLHQNNVSNICGSLLLGVYLLWSLLAAVSIGRSRFWEMFLCRRSSELALWVKDRSCGFSDALIDLQYS